MKKVKLTTDVLKKIIAEERQKLHDLGMLKESDETDVDKFLSHYDKLTLKEASLKKQLRNVKILKEKISKTLKHRS
tara:strand:- start:300 stop:527 length:228 start_codon:yes stop_codon:yes gene_type:complete